MTVEGLDPQTHVCEPWRFQDGDVLVVKCSDTLTSEAMERLNAALETFSTRLLERYGTRIEIIVMEPGLTLECARSGEHEAAALTR